MLATETMGERMRRLRLEQRLSQTDVARAAGTSRAYIANLELGYRERPGADILLGIARRLGTTVEELSSPSTEREEAPPVDQDGASFDGDEDRILAEFREMARRRWNADAIVLLRNRTDREGESSPAVGYGLDTIRLRQMNASLVGCCYPSTTAEPPS